MPTEGAPRRRLGPVARRLARAPILLYRVGLGGLFGHRFVMVEHVGRRTGRIRRTVLEVIRHDDRSVDTAAAWGRRSDWFRNVVAHPLVRVSTGRLRRAPATAEVLDPAAAAEVFARYAAGHPRAARALATTLGVSFEDPRALAERIPVVRFHLDVPSEP